VTTYRTARFPDCIARPRSRGARPTGPASPDVVTSWLYPVDRDLMPHQIEAIAAVMQLFVDDDIANGVSPKATRVCDACGQQRPSPGFVRYDERELCNP
jgi:hypothetical protein